MWKKYLMLTLICCVIPIFSACNIFSNNEIKDEPMNIVQQLSSNQPNTTIQPQIKDNGKNQTDVEIITDITNWNHPAKGILAENPFYISKLELHKNETYPIFYVEYPTKFLDINEEDYIMDICNNIARANSYWDFEMRNEKDNIIVKVICDKQKKVVSDIYINGEKDYFENLISIRDKEFELFLRNAHKDTNFDVLTQGDINMDGVIELLVLFNDKYYLIKNQKGTYEKIDYIKDVEYSVGRSTGVKIMQLDQTGTNYIVVDEELNSGEGLGFSIYKLNGRKVVCVNSNTPKATGVGLRKVEDINGDGIFEDVSVYNYSDTQMHQIKMYRKFDGTGEYSYLVSYNNKSKKFVYPEKAEEVIKNYIEDMYNKEALKDEIEKLIIDKKLTDFDIEKYVDLSGMSYYGIDLDLKIVFDSTESKKIKQDKLSFIVDNVDGYWKIKSIFVE